MFAGEADSFLPSCAALETDLASKDKEAKVPKAQLEPLSAAALAAVNYLPSLSSSAEQALPS
jgi:hypothetical protein